MRKSAATITPPRKKAAKSSFTKKYCCTLLVRQAAPPVYFHVRLCAAMGMARLWRGQGKRVEARELIAPVYGWFTEGFDTLDLKEAEALLDELAV